jgi:hypothetical protein
VGSRHVVHELEHHVAEAGLGERATFAGVNLLRLQELDTALFERADGLP